jgi:hypothetical protein
MDGLEGRNEPKPVEPDKPALPAKIAEQWDGWDDDRKRLYVRRKVNRSVRYRILKRDGFRCQLCGRGKDDVDDEGKPVRLHVDHILPIGAGGTSDDSNLQTLCFDCNRGKGDGVEELEELEGIEEPEMVEPGQQEEPTAEPGPRFVAGDIMPNGTVFDPGKHRIFPNGTVYDMERKRIVCAPSPEHAPITKSNAKAYALKRWELSRAAFAAGVAKGMVGRGATPVDAWQAVGEKSAELLKKATSARGFADLARFTGEAAGFVPMARGREEMQEQEQQQPQIINLIFAYIASKSEPAEDVIDA